MTLTPLHASIMGLLATVCLFSFAMLFLHVQRGATPSIESHWGGLGGGLGGWRISPAFTYLLTGTCAAALMTSLAWTDRNNTVDLKRKYASVERLARHSNVLLSNFHVEKDRLIVRGAAPSQEEINRVWDQIKLIDPDYPDITAEFTIKSTAATAKPEAPASAKPQQSQRP